MFCKHGVCLGFQLMESAESPRTAFDILIRRFQKMPKLIIYDNSCKLHLFALKREPVRFRNTHFLVDRLHYRKGHVGCSVGYSMDSYDADKDIVTINSQTNEQANASLRRLSTQLTYMHPSNVIKHTSVFLAIRNMDKMMWNGFNVITFIYILVYYVHAFASPTSYYVHIAVHVMFQFKWNQINK
jgi:hypothetical protein